jgi:hypothetical protein
MWRDGEGRPDPRMASVQPNRLAGIQGLIRGDASLWGVGLPDRQTRGTMVARANGNSGKFVTGGARSLLRSKSIRRSK